MISFYTVRWETYTVAFWIVLDVHEITVLFFLFYPNCWLCATLLWLDIHFSWRAVPNLSATDLVRITLVSEVGFQW